MRTIIQALAMATLFLLVGCNTGKRTNLEGAGLSLEVAPDLAQQQALAGKVLFKSTANGPVKFMTIEKIPGMTAVGTSAAFSQAIAAGLKADKRTSSLTASTAHLGDRDWNFLQYDTKSPYETIRQGDYTTMAGDAVFEIHFASSQKEFAKAKTEADAMVESAKLK
jgi:hypothetical protein